MTPVLKKFIQDFKTKKVLIFGLGLQGGGAGLATFFHQIGSLIRVTDLKPPSELQSSVDKLKKTNIELILGEHRQEDIEWADVIIKNPAIPADQPLLVKAHQSGKYVTMAAALFLEYAQIKTIGITGTRGKSTTTQLIYQLLKTEGFDVLLGGNIPDKPILPLLKSIKTKDTIAIIELSSWQLNGFHQEKISPSIAVVLNIYPDHLNRYKSIKDYINDKRAIVSYQNKANIAIINKQNYLAAKMSRGIKSKIIWFEESQFPNWQLNLPGKHNRENAAAAYTIAKLFNVSEINMKQIFAKITTLPMRLETITTIKGVNIINDSTSTTPTSVQKAIQSIKPPITLILGGETKKLPVARIAEDINLRVANIILLSGSGTQEIKPHLEDKKIVGEFTDLEAAIKQGLVVSPQNSSLLFSPGFTSFGMFKNEFDRGDQFNAIIKKLS